jgi:hypothetical protein
VQPNRKTIEVIVSLPLVSSEFLSNQTGTNEEYKKQEKHKTRHHTKQAALNTVSESGSEAVGTYFLT